ncbi:NAD-dependent epimerase/dehydratase family protein [Nonomuraea rubra]
MKRALVTGSAGFVGRHMEAELLRRGWVVDVCDIDDRAGGIDAHDVFRVHTLRYDLVVHCAARSPHRAAIDLQPGIMPYNVALDAAMFSWALRTRPYRVLYLSSSAAYPVGLQAGIVPYRLHEDDVVPDLRVTADLLDALGDAGKLAPDGTYGWTKLAGERMAAAAAAADLAVHVVRPFSGYGTDQGTDWPFGAFVDRARHREDPFTIWGSGHQVRDWIHIDDVVAGALAVVDADERRPVNLCTGRGTSMIELATMVCNAAGYTPVFEPRPEAPAGVAYRVGDPSRLNEIYRPRVALEQGVTRAILEGLPA